MKTLSLMKSSSYVLLVLILSFAFTNANAAIKYYDDFEDGNANGWLETYNGSGSTGVELHNASQMAFAKHSGNGSHKLSIDFNYLSSDILSFDMHAVAYPYGSAAHAASGVELSFLNNFNVELGSIRFVNTTTSSWIGTDDNPIDDQQHYFNASMSDFAALAGLGASDSISKLSLSFFAQAQTTSWGRVSTATVWFDNVNISDASVVPVPAAVWLFGSGLLGLLGMSRRNRE